MPSQQLAFVLNHFKGLKGNDGKGFTARCPAHDDKVASLSAEQKGDRILLFCHTGCPTEQIVAAIGMTMADLFIKEGTLPAPLIFRPRENPSGERLAAVYDYTDGAGNVVAQKGRFELPGGKKTFRWRLPDTEKWSGLGGIPMADLALWGAEQVAAAPADCTVYFVEGEKAALACRDHGLLAVTHAGGASTRDFGASLELLRDRRVALWGDNDAPGSEYIAAVHARIRDSAAEVRVVGVPLPAKGDAYDYFALGGTVAELAAGATLIAGPSVEYIGTDHIVIRTPVGIGTVTFDFDEIEKKTRDLDTELTITINAPGMDKAPYTERVNLLSNSARGELRKDLEAVYGKEFGWTKLLNTIFGLCRKCYLSMDRSVDIFDVEPLAERELFFHDPLISMNAVNIFFGDRQSLKSYVAYTIGFCCALGEPLWGQRVPQGPVLVIDYEDNKENFRRRIDRIATGLGMPLLPNMIRYENLMGVPLADAARAIRKRVVNEGIVLVIVDSAGPAVSGKPEDAVSAIPLMQALRRLGVTVILIAHVPKNRGGEQPKDPFGSVFYSNLARRTWYMERVQEEASDLVDVGLYCKKVNDGPVPHPIALSVNFAGLNGPVTLQRQAMSDSPALQERRDLGDRLWDALERGKLATIKQLAEELDSNPKEVEHALVRSKRRFVAAGQTTGGSGRPSKLWGRAALEA